MENRALDHQYLQTVFGVPLDQLEVEVRPLRGGLVSQSVTHATARYVDAAGKRRSLALVVKALEGSAAREASVYEHLSESDVRDFAPSLRAVDRRLSDRCSLYLEAIRPITRWPWRDIGFAQKVLDALARLHAFAPGESLRTALSGWDYETELMASAKWTLEFVDGVCQEHRAGEFRSYMPSLRRVIANLPEMRQRLMAFAPFGQCLIHGDVHPGNVMIRRRRGQDIPVLFDWARARIGSPLEDVSSWLQSLGYWEPQAKRRHDTLLTGYLGARGLPPRLPHELRSMYWVAAASNVLAGALRYHVFMMTSTEVTGTRRDAALNAARDALRVVRRADALWKG